MGKTEYRKKQFVKRCKNWIKDNLSDNLQDIDIVSHFDSELNNSENFEHFRDMMVDKGYVEPDPSYDEEAFDDYVERENKKMSKKVDIKEYYKEMHRALDKMLHNYSNIVMIKGRAGIGKSVQIKSFLKENNVDYAVVKKISRAYFYRFLYEHNGEWIWINDVMRIFNDTELKEMLKSIGETDPEDRLITNYTYSHENKNLPKSFITTSKFIFDYNDDNMSQIKFKEDFRAIKSRADYIELVFDDYDVHEMMRKIAQTKEEKEITEFLIDNYRNIGNNELNLRTQNKAFKTVGWAKDTKRDWKEELKHELRMNLSPVKSLLYRYMGKRPISRTELKKCLIRSGEVNTVRTAERRITNWLECDELHIVSDGKRNHLVSIFRTD